VKFKYVVSLVLALVVVLMVSVLGTLPKSEPKNIEAVVTSKGTRSNYGPSGDRLRLRIDTGKLVTVSIGPQAGIRVGDRVVLNTYDRYMFGPKYQFVKLLRQ